MNRANVFRPRVESPLPTDPESCCRVSGSASRQMRCRRRRTMSFNRADIAIAAGCPVHAAVAMIEITLQDHLRSDLIDIAARRPRVSPGIPQRAICRDRREAFVPSHDMARDSGREVSPRIARPVQRLRTETSVHVSRQSDDDSARCFFRERLSRYAPSTSFALSRKRFQRMRKQTEFIGNGETDARPAEDRYQESASSQHRLLIAIPAEVCRRGS